MREKKIIVYELNEVPRRLIDLYINLYPNSFLAKFIRDGALLNTITKDEGELHPWSTWPSVHRGVYNSLHKIKFLNQDLTYSKQYKPIWEILSDNGLKVGIFGSLQSYPPIKHKNIKFFLPDTFAPSPDAYPLELEMFQAFNLNITSENKAISRRINLEQILIFLNLMNKKIISKGTFFQILIHLLKELSYGKYKKRRSIMQNTLSFDLFLKNVYESKPNFCTYFTNHVAGMMHRYWRDLFPEDFNIERKDIDKFNSKSILKAMHLVDDNLKHLMKLVDEHGYEIYIISSMGQKSIDRGKYIPELVIREFNKFVRGLNLDFSKYKLLPAMQPDYCVESSDEISMQILREAISKIEDKSGNKIIKERYKPVGLKLNLMINKSKSINLIEKLIIDGKEFHLEDLGLESVNRDIGTGYHTPEGIFAYYGSKNNFLLKNKNKVIETNQICPTFLKIFKVDIPDYMQKPLF